MTLPTVHDSNQWMACNASVQAQNLYPALPGEPSESKLEGRACHEIAQTILKRWQSTSAPLDFSDIVGTLSRDGLVITDELYDAASVYVNDIMEYFRLDGVCADVRIEQRESLDEFIEGWYCIPDASAYDARTNTLTVWDAKFGHAIVDVFENWQPLIGALAILKRLALPEDVARFTKLDLRIVQPRGFHRDGPVRKWFVTNTSMHAYRSMLVDALPRVTGPNPIATVGPQCRNCTARAHCDALSRACYSGIDFARELRTHNLGGHNLGVELKLLRWAEDMVKFRMSGIEEQALHAIRTGNPVTFFTAEQGKGRERWIKDTPVEQIIMMGDLSGVNVRGPVQLCTPKQARDKGIDELVIKQYSETPNTALKLVEVNGDKTRQIFTKEDTQ